MLVLTSDLSERSLEMEKKHEVVIKKMQRERERKERGEKERITVQNAKETGKEKR
jgi:hypothetical protein